MVHTANPIYTFVYMRELPRLFAAAAPAGLAALALFLLMLSLIDLEAPVLEEPPARIADVIMEPPQPPEVFEQQPADKPAEPEVPPVWEVASVVPEAGTDVIVFDNSPADPIAMDPVTGTGGGGIVAYLKVEPIYPSRALQRGIEGYVDLAFDITAAGGTDNIRVLAAEPAGVFEKAAISALRKWKYKVPLIDGVATGQPDMSTRISFALEK